MYNSIEDFMNRVKHKDPNETEFHQAVHEVVESLWDFWPLIENICILEFWIE